jgi:S1-C subfamily serine protease
LKEDDIGFIDQVREQCGLPLSGLLTSDLLRSRDCVKDAYSRKRVEWLSRLTGEAREEALRPLEEHLALQQALQQLGFLSAGLVDGVYARGTRGAIAAWQSARGRAVTGFLGDADARALVREISAGSQTVAQGPQQSQNGFSGAGKAPEPGPPQLASREEPKSSVAEPKAQIAGTGTAFAISKTGDFLTNYHVVKGCASVRLGNAGVRTDGLVIANDERNDLAVVRAQISGVPLLHFREGKPIRPADPIVVLGFPYAGLLATTAQVTTGAISALAGVRDDTRYFQLTAPVQPGNSGGPLLDLSGNVVGIVTARINALAVAEATGTLPENINFAIKSLIVRGFLEANRIDYETAQSTGKLDPADVGESAAKSVVMLECLK